MEKKKNVPRLRFPGFADEWEQRKLSDLSIVSTGYPFDSKDFSSDGQYLVITNGNIQDESAIVNNSIGNHITVIDEKIITSYLLDIGDILVTMDGTVGRTAKVADNGQILAQRVGRIKAFENEEFLYQWLNTGTFAKTMVGLSHGGTIKHISLEEIRSFEAAVPQDADEQEKIGRFFEMLDRTITLHQRKLDTIKQYKQGMFQKMFPKEREKVPEIRFPGFTTNWDSVCLGDLYKERNERGNDNLPILSVSIHTGVSGGELDTEELGKNVRRSEDKSLYKRVYSGDLVFNMMRAWQGAIGVVKNEGMVSPAYISAVPNEGVYPPFMDYLLRRNEVINQINNLSYGVTDFRKRLYWDSFVQVGVCLPSLEEQMMITALFQEMDSYLSVNQKKVNQMLQYKQGLLQQMFV